MAKDKRVERLGQRIRELREERGLSRKQLAELAGLSERGLIKWELGEREPGWFNVLALCDALGVSCEDFKVEPQSAPSAGRGRPRKEPAPAEGKPTADKPASKSKREKKKT